MSNDKQAEAYQRISNFQREDGKQLIENVNPSLGDAILEMGCGTGELSLNLAELVGQDAKVVAVDPDINRIKVAQETHKEARPNSLEWVRGDLRHRLCKLCASLDSE